MKRTSSRLRCPAPSMVSIAILLVGEALLGSAVSAQDPERSREALADREGEEVVGSVGELLAGVPESQTVVRGRDHWLFLRPELRCLVAGPFWGGAARNVSRATDPDTADPLPAILDFASQLEGAGIELLLVPVPLKVSIYPDQLIGGPPPRGPVAPTFSRFYAMLEENGVEVLDLAPVFFARRLDEAGAVYCKQDAHWSGRGIELAAERVYEQIRDREWVAAVPKREYASETRAVTIRGDLLERLGDESIEPESIPLTVVGERDHGSLKPVPPWRESPVLLLGDSHNLVFSQGDDMHAAGAGLADHLDDSVVFAVVLLAVRGSGSTPARLSLLRRRDNLAGKRLVIWCFSAREFTESHSGWKPLPIIRTLP